MITRPHTMHKHLSVAMILCVLFCGCATDYCETVNCQNGGICNTGTCECPEGYFGSECEYETPDPEPPSVWSPQISNITTTSATINAEVLYDNGSSVTERGIRWGMDSTLTSGYQTVNGGGGIGSFTLSLTDLSPSTRYYVQAYAINGNGTGLSTIRNFMTVAPHIPAGNVSDIDGNSYPTVMIDGKRWMASNLRTSRYANGESVQHVPSEGQWASITQGAYSWLDNNSSYDNQYGKLYNGYAVVDPRNLCPTGWHVATEQDWIGMVTYLDPDAAVAENIGTSPIAGNKLKSTGSAHWSLNEASTNETGFSALPGGYRGETGTTLGQGMLGYWWTGSHVDADPTRVYSRNMGAGHGSIGKGMYLKATGLSVRCVQN